MISFEQLRKDGQNPIAVFDRLFRSALESLVPDLASMPYYVRERSVVNLFVFGHLVPKFQEKGLDIRQICIEEGMEKIRESEKARYGRYADIVVWLHPKATVWRTCRPLAVVEWKNISCREQDGQNPSGLRVAHEGDIAVLQRNADLFCIGYAVLTDQRNMRLKLEYTQVSPESSRMPILECSATYATEEAEKLQGPDENVRTRKQACPNCLSTTGSPERHRLAASLDS